MVDLVLVHDQAVGAQAVEQAGVVVECTGDGGHEGALLGVGRAADAAITQVPATFDVARNDLPAVAQFLTALAQDAIVDVGVYLPGRHGMPFFPAVEPGRHGLRAEVFQSKLVGPIVQGRLWCTETAGPVHRGGTANTAALKNGDRSVPGNPAHAFLIEVGIGGLLVHLEVFLVIQPAFFNEDDGQSAASENLCSGPTTGAGSDNNNVGFRGQAFRQSSTIGDFPARFQAPGNTIG